ncbi:helix-turn-helix domain-containing protein [Burkholderia sp. Ac-20353]|uniref:helix-turn-helix domain-containing protein n=1 Tax=Burkholderia sp. Ac-20353 TaxID=2703894 RepID=UPI00197B6C25|nr:helix-turn-helix domain-containing protein [Burkholderia sp. Ac-20353]MBN3786314.1 helix-turn-helix domain-containing protein [Burkholderia sp. Ac-20353]
MPSQTDKDMLVALIRQLDRHPELLERVFDCLPDVLYYVKDANARYLSVNQTLIDRSGLARDDVIGKTADQLFPVTGASTVAQDLSVIENKSPIVDRLRLYSTGIGHKYWCLSSKFPIIDENESGIGMIGVSRDLPRPDERHHGYRRLFDFLAYLEQHLSQNILITEAADHASISVDTLERLTREVFHLTPKQLLMKMRIDHACKLLETTDHSITEIAASCGYADHSAFTRQFKLATHLTPRQYRDARGRGLHPA